MKFDFCIMNPPFSGSLHLEFLDKVTDLCEKSVVIEPGQWLVQLKENGKYTKDGSLADKIKKKIDGHVKSIELNNYNKELNIANKTVCSISCIDFSKQYNEIEFECITEKSKVKSLKDCNLVGDSNLVFSILEKCKKFKDHMSDHCIVLKKYKEYEDKGYWFVPYGNYMINNLGTMQSHGWTPAFHTKNHLLDTLNSYFAVLCSSNKDSISQKVHIGSRSGNASDSVYGTKEEIENWYHFVYTNKLPVFINICLTIDENNNSKEYVPWLVDKKYTDEEIYNLLNINKEEQELIDKTLLNYDKDSQFGKRLFSLRNEK